MSENKQKQVDTEYQSLCKLYTSQTPEELHSGKCASTKPTQTHGLLLCLSPHDLQTVIILLILALNLERIPTGTCAWMKMGKNKHLTSIG